MEKAKKMLYHVTYCKKKAYICPSETIKTLVPAKTRQRQGGNLIT